MARRTTGRKPRSRGRKVVAALVTAGVAALLVQKGSDAGPDSSLKNCYDQLVGDACNDVWHRTQRVLGAHKPDTNDALHTAFLYVCVEKHYAAPPLCGAFRAKATRLKIDGWRYSRRFRDRESVVEPACPSPSGEDQTVSQEELDVLDDARRRLDTRSRLILDLAYQEDLTDVAIGGLLKPPLSAVRVGVLRRAAERELEGFLKRCQ